MELDKYKCRRCKSPTNLQVHHLGYVAGSDPWQYPDEYLIYLCEICHSTEELFKKRVKAHCEALAMSGISWADIDECLSMAFDDAEVKVE